MKSFLACKQQNITAGQIQKVAFTGEFFAVKSMTGDFTFRMRENDDFVPGAVGLEYHFEKDEEFKEIEVTATSNVTVFFYYGVGKFTLGKGIKTYRALIGTSGDVGVAPTAIALENTIGPIVPSWTSPGLNSFTLAGAFPLNKTFVRLNSNDQGGGGTTIVAFPLNTDVVQILDTDGDNGVACVLEILVYP